MAGDPVDTSAEAVERLAKRMNLHSRWDVAAATLRALAKERDALKHNLAVADLLTSCVEGQRDATRAAALAAASREREAWREAADLKLSVIAFCAPWAVEHAKAHGLPPGHLFPTHYDILAKAGARMDSFTRAARAQEPRHD